MLCPCEDVEPHMDMAYCLVPLPDSATPEQRMARYMDCVMLHMRAGTFDTRRVRAIWTSACG